MAHDGAMTSTGRTVRVRTEQAALTKTFDYAVPAGWTDDVRRGHPGAHAAARAQRARLGGRRRRGPAPRRGRPAAEVVAGLGPAPGPGRTGRLGGLALGRAGRLLPADGVTRGARALAARRARGGVGPTAGRTTPAVVVRPGGRRREHGAPSPGHRPDRPRPVRRGRPRRAGAPRQRGRPGPLGRLGGRAWRRAWSGGAGPPRRSGPGRGRAGPSWWAAGRAPGPPCPGWPPQWCSMRTTRRTARRARRPTAPSTCWWSGPGAKACRACCPHPCRRCAWPRSPCRLPHR